MKKPTKISTLILALILCLACLASCGEKKPSEGLEFSPSNDGAGYYVSQLGSCTDSEIVIPSNYNGKLVKGIDDQAFRGCVLITSVVLPEGITFIGEMALSKCTSLTNITIPNSVKKIKAYAFADCSSLEEVVIGKGVSTIGLFAFKDCDALKSITYEGTKAQWEDIQKSSGWDDGTENYTVHCTDGDIAK